VTAFDALCFKALNNNEVSAEVPTGLYVAVLSVFCGLEVC